MIPLALDRLVCTMWSLHFAPLRQQKCLESPVVAEETTSCLWLGRVFGSCRATDRHLVSSVFQPPVVSWWQWQRATRESGSLGEWFGDDLIQYIPRYIFLLRCQSRAKFRDLCKLWFWKRAPIFSVGRRRRICAIYFWLFLLFMAEILHQLIGSLSHYSQGFVHPTRCRISSINS